MRVLSSICYSAVACSLLMMPTESQARQEHWPNWYLGLHGDVSFIDDPDLSGAATGEVDLDTGYAFGVALGYRPPKDSLFFDNSRFEVQYAYRAADFESLGATALTGEVEHDEFFLNIYHDLGDSEPGTFTPYIGAGVGFISAKYEDAGLNVNDTDLVFAYQGMLGVFYSPENLPQTDWGFGYRYIGSMDPEFTTNAGANVEGEFQAHNITANAMFRF